MTDLRIRTRARLLVGIVQLTLALLAATATVTAQEGFQATHYAFLDGESEVPSVETTAEGIAMMMLDPTAGTLQYRITVTGLSGPITAAHFHRGEPGVTGSPIHTITFNQENKTAVGVWTVGDLNDLQMLIDGDIYLNVHTAANSGGEIRGQVILIPNAAAPTMSPAFEVPPVVGSNATGEGTIWIDPVSRRVSYEISWQEMTSDVTAAHFHKAEFGAVGSPVHTIQVEANSTSATGVWENVSTEDLTALATGGMYVNIHTVDNPNGEIRGQVFAMNVFMASVSSLNEVPPITAGANAAGTGVLSSLVTPLGFLMSGDFIVEGTTGPIVGAHIHGGPVGENGPIVRTLMPFPNGTEFLALEQTPISLDSLAILNNAGMYVNFHTGAFVNGEARGQLVAAAGNLISGVSSVPDGKSGEIRLTWVYDRGGETLRFTLPEEVREKEGRIILYDLLGRVVADVETSIDGAVVDAGTIPAGVYVATVTIGGIPSGSCRVAVVR